jgi:signal transduction histidine kinase/CheY-like chemotaxis protein
VFAVAVLAVAVGAAALAISIYADLERAVTTPRENIQWAAYQIQAEHLRLMLAAREAEAGRLDIGSLDQRYQIFVSRVLILRDGDVYVPMRQIPGYEAVLSRAVELVPIVDAALARDARTAAEYAAILLQHLGGLADPMQQVALQAVRTASNEQTVRQLHLLDMVSYLAVTLVLIVAASIGLAFVVMKQFAALESGRRQLSDALLRAEESSRAKSRFLAGMSHEMRTPLNAVIGMLREISYRTSDTSIHRLVETAHASAEMLCGLVDDVLDTTRIETGKFQFHHSSFDPAFLVEEVASVLASRAEDHNNAVFVETEGTAARFVTTDRARIKQVLINLLGNAIKFTSDGSITVRASVAPGSDHATLLRIAVSDTGIGIPSDQHERIFGRFFQAGANDGLGLGLSISREIVERLGGRIGVDSRPGAGSTFWFEVPVTVSDAPATPKTDASGHGRLTGLRLLVAEDNVTNRQVVRLLLERQGAGFEFAINGEQAVAMAMASRYDLVLMDINMPVMDGLQALEALHRQGGPDLPPVVALTADALAEDHARFLAAGMAACVTKPIEEHDLLRTIATVLRRPDITAARGPQDASPARAADSGARLTETQRAAVMSLISSIGNEEDVP